MKGKMPANPMSTSMKPGEHKMDGHRMKDSDMMMPPKMPAKMTPKAAPKKRGK